MSDAIVVGDYVRCRRTGAVGKVFRIVPMEDRLGMGAPDLVMIEDGSGANKGIVRDRPSLEKIAAS